MLHTYNRPVPLPTTEAELVAKACKLIDASEQILSLHDLATALGYSRSHFHRMFKRVTGITPRQYATAQRSDRVREMLAKGVKVTDALYQSGFNSSSRFYEKSTELLGMTPTHYRQGGKHEVLHFALGESTLGSILVASSANGVVAIALGDDPEVLLQNLQERFANARLVGRNKDYESLVAKVVGYIEAPNIGLDLPLDIRGTAFQCRVWQALRHIPAGETATYTQVAERIGSPTAARAVAGACAANKIALAIPCHRVIRNDGALSGYAWGVKRKRQLLERESALP